MTASTTGGLFSGTFARGGAAPEVSDAAWLAAMLDVEAALAGAQAAIGLVPAEVAAEVAGACRPEFFDIAELGVDAARSGNPVIPLVAALRERVKPELRRFVHYGATSQDINDTASMLIACRALVPILADLSACADACAAAGRRTPRHRHGRAHGPAARRARHLRAQGRGLDERAGPLARPACRSCACPSSTAERRAPCPSWATGATRCSPRLAAELGLADPVIPWHTDRTPVARLACALGMASGTLGKIATDVKLLAQTEVGEAAEPTAPGRGNSSAMPHKRNPVGAMSVLACVQRVPGLVASVLGGMLQEHERAAGPWQAEWETLGELLRLTGSAASWLREVLEGLTVDASRMRANLDATRGLMMAEQSWPGSAARHRPGSWWTPSAPARPTRACRCGRPCSRIPAWT